MSAHFAAQSIVRRQTEAPSAIKEESSAIYPDMALFHSGGEGPYLRTQSGGPTSGI